MTHPTIRAVWWTVNTAPVSLWYHTHDELHEHLAGLVAELPAGYLLSFAVEDFDAVGSCSHFHFIGTAELFHALFEDVEALADYAAMHGASTTVPDDADQVVRQ